MNLFDLTGKRALITGATHGLGMAMARALGKAGAKLIINGHSPERLQHALEVYRKEGFDAEGYLFDITDEQAVKTSVDRIEKREAPSTS